MTVSLCLIAKDEAEQLPGCLASARDLVDEIVVLDTGSTDGTPDIAQSLGAKVYTAEWTDDFAAARNQCLAYAQSDWILVLDADERLVPGVIPTLRQLVDGAYPTDASAPAVLLVNLVRQEVGSNQPAFSLVSRLFRRHPELQFSRPYHELVDDSAIALIKKDPNWQVLTLAGVAIIHEGYTPKAIAERDKFARARRIMEKHLANQPDDAYLCNKLGALYVQSGEIDRGIALLQQGLAAAKEEPPLVYELHYHLGLAHQQQQKFSAAIAHYRQAVDQPVLHALKVGAYTNLGALLKERGQFDEAKTVLETLVEMVPQFPVGHFNLGAARSALGDLPGAIAAYRDAIRLNFHYPEAWQNLGVALLKAGQVMDSRAAFQQAIALYTKDRPLEAEQLRRKLIELGIQVPAI